VTEKNTELAHAQSLNQIKLTMNNATRNCGEVGNGTLEVKVNQSEGQNDKESQDNGPVEKSYDMTQPRTSSEKKPGQILNGVADGNPNDTEMATSESKKLISTLVDTHQAPQPIKIKPAVTGNTTSKPLLSKPSTPSVPLHINTPNGTIPLDPSKCSTVNGITSNATKTTNMTKPSSHIVSSSKMGRSSSAHAAPVKEPRTIPKSSPIASAKQLQRTTSTPVQRMQTSKMQAQTQMQTLSPAKPNLIPIKPNPNTAPSVYFHPIAIRPKPSLHVAPKSTRTKIAMSRSHSSSSAILNSTTTIPKTGADGPMTPSTSKTWVLPPRPKTKKVTKKKDKKTTVTKATLTLNSASTIHIPKKHVLQHPTNASSPITNSALVGTSLPPVSAKQQASTNKELKKKLVTTAAASTELAPTMMSRSGTPSMKSNVSTACTKCSISPSIRSVQLNQATGKVSINAQIHSNINIYTNDEGELEVQLQHVTRENDNLKKILLKLNKEIQNLKISKDKGGASNAAAFAVKRDIKKPTSSSSLKAISMNRNRTNSTAKQSTTTSDSTKVLPPQFSNYISDSSITPNMFSSANTIDPVNLSYNLESKRQKVLSMSPEGTESTKLAGKNEKLSTKTKSKTTTKKAPTSEISSSTAGAKSKNKDVTEMNIKKEFHSCGVCEIGQKCVCFELQTASLATTIAQALSRNGINILGMSNNAGIAGKAGMMGMSMNALKEMSHNKAGLSTLNSILRREEVMKKLKEGDRKALTNILDSAEARVSPPNDHSTDTITPKAMENVHLTLLNDNICGINTEKNKNAFNDNSHDIHTDNNDNDINNQLTGNTTIHDMNMVPDDDEELLNLIDAELSLDPTPLMSSVLMKSGHGMGFTSTKAATTNDNSTLKIFQDGANERDDFPIVLMEHNKSDSSRVSQKGGASTSGNNDALGLSTLMDFNNFSSGDALVDGDAAILFDDIGASVGDDFMIY
jgi:hypothetical protein